MERSPQITVPQRSVNTAVTENGSSLVAPVVRAPVASLEELSDLSESSSGEFMENGNKTVNGNSSSKPADTSRLEEALETLGMLESSLPGHEPNSANSCGNYAGLLFIQDRKAEAEELVRLSFENLSEEQEMIELELLFYQFVYQSKDTRNDMDNILSKGVYSNAFSLDLHVSKAKELGHATMSRSWVSRRL